MALGERDRLILDIERGWWLEGETKGEIVRTRLRVSLSRYNQLLTALLERPDAEEYDPLVVRRLRRAKQRRRWAAMGAQPADGRHPR
jgi:Protein of unknown function (DUF3263)